MKRKALGRGLGALIPEVAPSTEGILEVDLDRIDPNPFQPRTIQNHGDLEGLVKSIQANGIVQPVLLRRQKSRYQLIAGERRWRASRQAGLLKIPAVVRNIPDDQLLEYALIENIQRQELTPIEEAQAYRRLIQDLGLTQNQVAERVGRDRTSIANTMRLLKLPETVIGWVHAGRLSMGHARALLALSQGNLQLKLARETIKGGLSVRAVEIKVKRMTQSSSSTPSTKRSSDPNVTSAVDHLRQALGTKVDLLGGEKRGRIVIHYYSAEDLNRLFQKLTEEPR